MPHASRSLVVVFIVGSVAAVDPWGWAPYGPLRWAVISTVGFALVAVAIRGGSRVHQGSALGWAGFLILGAAVSTVALDPLYTWIGTPDRHLGWVTFLLFAGLFVTGQQMNDDESIQWVLKACVVASLLLGSYTLLEVFDVAPVDLVTASGRPGGPFGTAAYLAAATALLVPVAIGAAVDGLGAAGWRYAAAIAGGAGIFAALASQTRAGWVGLAVAAIVALPAIAGWLRSHWQVVVAGAGAMVLIAAISPVGSRVSSAFDFADGTARGRIDEWQIGAAVVTNHPITGVGFEGYRIAFAEGVDADYERRYTRITMPDRVHNGALDVGATTGIPGLGLYLAAITFLGWRAWRAVRSETPWMIGLAAAVVGYAAQQQFLFPIAEVDPIFWLFAGVLVAATSREEAKAQLPKWTWLLPAVLATVALVAGILDVAADHRLATSADRLAVGELSPAADAAIDAAGLRPDSIRYHLAAGLALAAPGTVDGYRAATARVGEGLEISPGDPILRAERASLQLRLAQAARDRAALDQAIDEWRQLVADDPVHARYRFELGNAYAIAGNFAAAESELLTAASLAPRSAAALTNLAAIYIEQGRFDEASALLDQARTIDPDAPEIAILEGRIDG